MNVTFERGSEGRPKNRWENSCQKECEPVVSDQKLKISAR